MIWHTIVKHSEELENQSYLMLKPLFLQLILKNIDMYFTLILSTYPSGFYSDMEKSLQYLPHIQIHVANSK